MLAVILGICSPKKPMHKPNIVITPDAIKDTIMSQSYHIRPQNAISGVISVPGDKSISHRSIMFGALADGVTHVTGFFYRVKMHWRHCKHLLIWALRLSEIAIKLPFMVLVLMV